MLKNGAVKEVTKNRKTFFEVLPENVTTFRQSMGQNVIWFASAPNPFHLHTLLADQNGGKNLQLRDSYLDALYDLKEKYS